MVDCSGSGACPPLCGAGRMIHRMPGSAGGRHRAAELPSGDERTAATLSTGARVPGLACQGTKSEAADVHEAVHSK